MPVFKHNSYIWADQTDVDISLVDRIARLLVHEAPDNEEGIRAVAYTLFNRTCVNNKYLFTENKDINLYNVITAGGQYEMFQYGFNPGLGDANKPDPNNNPMLRPDPFDPLDYIERTKDINPYMKQKWEYSLEISKIMVSICGNPNMTTADKRNNFKNWVPNPFPEMSEGRGVNVDRVVQYAKDGHGGRFIHKDGWEHYFGYMQNDSDEYWD